MHTNNPKHPLIVIALWLVTVACMMYVKSEATVLLFLPLLALTGWYVYAPLLRLLRRDWPFSAALGVFSAAYFLLHAPRILSLELWSDEILSLSLSSGPFSSVAQHALQIGDIPPYHYWELWIWQKAVQGTPAELTEFIYRIPSMAYHAAAAILFSLVVVTIYKAKYQSRTATHHLVRILGFALYFFNPLMFPYALEVRPYALMALGSVALLTRAVSPIIDSAGFIPIQLLVFLTSFFHAVLYVPKAIVLFFNRGSRHTSLLTMVSAIVLVGLCVPFVRMPNQTSVSVSAFIISRALSAMGAVFVPDVSYGIAFGLMIACSLIQPRFRLFLFQTVFMIAAVSILSYAVRYQALAPRHYIVVIPMILAFMTAPLYVPGKAIRYAGVLALSLFVFRWVLTTEHMLNTRAFAPKISIGIKEAIQRAHREQLPLALESSTPGHESEPGYNNYYFEEQAGWYLKRYGDAMPLRLAEDTVCDSVHTGTVHVIAYTNRACFSGYPNVSVLSLKVIEPTMRPLRYYFRSE